MSSLHMWESRRPSTRVSLRILLSAMFTLHSTRPHSERKLVQTELALSISNTRPGLSLITNTLRKMRSRLRAGMAVMISTRTTETAKLALSISNTRPGWSLFGQTAGHAQFLLDNRTDFGPNIWDKFEAQEWT